MIARRPCPEDHGNPLQPCQHCHVYTDSVRRRHMHTAYVEDEMNYVTCCWECFNVIEDYWDERWDEYNSGRL